MLEKKGLMPTSNCQRKRGREGNERPKGKKRNVKHHTITTG